MELLAPARRLESAIAAFDAGADAVYIGVPGFNARRMANEVTLNDIAKLVKYAHSKNKKVYGAINILIKDNEIKRVIETLFFLDEIKIDAIIFQDYGVLHIAKKYFPNLELHASTQTFVTNHQTLIMLKKMGVSRIILPRETTINEIIEYKKHTDIELEVFIHGALCHSVSGMCQFSGALTGKSGNRGMCIQACRKKFETKEKISKEYFSMKDLWVGKDIVKLKNLITSFKIEGRLKSPEWTSEVVKYYKSLLSGKDIKNQNRIKELFSRETTKGLLFNSNKIITKNFTGHIGKQLGDLITVKKGGIVVRLTQSLNIRDGVFVQRLKKSYSTIGIYKNNKKINKANIGETVLLVLRDVPKLYRDDMVFKHSDNSKKFNIRKVDVMPSKPMILLELSNAENGYIFVAKHKKKILLKNQLSHSNEISKNSVEDIIKEIFSTSGEFVFDIKDINISSKLKYFISKKELKSFKRVFYLEVEKQYNEKKDQYINEILDDLKFPEYSNIKKEERELFEDDENISEINKSKKIVPIDSKIIRDDLIYNVPAIIKDADLKFYVKNIKNKLKLNANKFYVQSINSLAILKNIVLENNEVEFYGGPFLHVINRASYWFFRETFGIKDFTISYEFTIDNKLPDWFWRIKYSEIIPLFVDVKSDETLFKSKEFNSEFVKKYSKIFNSNVLYMKKAMGSFTNYKKEQYEYLLKSKNSEDRLKIANYSFTIY